MIVGKTVEVCKLSHSITGNVSLYMLVNALLHLVTLDMNMACSPTISFLDIDLKKLLDVCTKIYWLKNSNRPVLVAQAIKKSDLS